MSSCLLLYGADPIASTFTHMIAPSATRACRSRELQCEVWLDPNALLETNHGYGRKELRDIERMVRENLELLRNARSSAARNLSRCDAPCGLLHRRRSMAPRVIATSDGNVTELFYHPQHGQGQAVLGNFYRPRRRGRFLQRRRSLSPYNCGDRRRQHLGAVLHSRLGRRTSAGGHFSGVVRIGAFWADDTFFRRRVLIACGDGRTHELRLQPGFAPLRSVVANNGPLVDVGGFFSSDDGYRHAITIDGSGTLQELLYRP
jgi:hypothetical protein